MTVSYASALKTTRMTAVITALDAGAGAAYMEICTSSYAVVLVTIALAKPSFTESGGVITLANTPRSNDAAQTGTAAIARIKDSNGNTIVSGLTVGVGTGDIQLNTTSIVASQAVSITSGTITHSA